MAKRRKYVGSDFDEFLRDEGLLEASTAVALKRVVAWQIAQAMKAERVTRKAMAARMKTSRTVPDRMLDENDTGLTIATLSRAAQALGRHVRVELAA
jgi:hypothetical protein